MKKSYFILLLYFAIASCKILIAQPMMWHQEISAVNINLDSSMATVLAQIPVNIPAQGNVEVRFDGYAIADSGDLIVVAASDYPDWGVNDGNVGAFAHDFDVDRMPFSHTRIYSVSAGPDTFYAVSQNYVCNDGSGFASIYGMLTVIYIPDSGDAILQGKGFFGTTNVRGAPVALDSLTINPAVSGTVVVRYDGICAPDDGDRIALAASDNASWGAGYGSVFLEANSAAVCLNDIPFSHSRVYHVNPGSHTFYAVAENVLEMDGSGDIWYSGSLTVEFIPDAGDIGISWAVISAPSVTLDNGIVTLANNSYTASVSGNTLIRFDGYCDSDSGDRIILAASNTQSYGPASASIELEAYSLDIHSVSFSHSRAYAAPAGNLDFYALGENQVETDGSGVASIMGTATMLFFPNPPTGISTTNFNSLNINIYPNPSNGEISLSFNNDKARKAKISVYDIIGKEIAVIIDSELMKGDQIFSWKNESNLTGVYLLRIESDGYSHSERILLLR